MREIRLYGALGKEFGSVHHFDVATVAEAFQALAVNFPRFVERLRHGFYRVVVGSKKTGNELDETTIIGHKLGARALHVIPVTKGRGRGGLGKIIAGIMLVGLSMISGGLVGAAMATQIGATSIGAMVGSIGVGMVLTGVASLIAPEMKPTGESDPSFTMAGPQVTMREGGIVPIAYGDVVTGGTMVSGVLKIENAAVSAPVQNPTTGLEEIIFETTPPPSTEEPTPPRNNEKD